MTFDLAAHQNVGDAFADRVAAHPERIAITLFRGSAAAEHDSLTYAGLAGRARSRAAALRARLSVGERVLIALPTGSDFVELYLGCLIAGVVAVPVPAVGGSTTAVERVVAIAEDCAPALALTTADSVRELGARLWEQGLGHVTVEAAGAIDADPAATPAADRPPPDRDTLAVLQYSSGSTGTPRGVMLTHGSILANTRSINTAGGLGPDDVFGSWLPLHHDMGLFALLTAGLLFGAPVVLMAPSEFARRPVEWLRMVDRYGCTVTAGPNFAFDLCLRLITDQKLAGVDLSRLRYALNGSEPIHLPTMRAFTERFASVGLRPEVVSPCYGLAEATAYVSANPVPATPRTKIVDPVRLTSAERPELCPATDGREIIGVGRAAIEARIVDPGTRHALPDRRIGEIWLRGGNVGLGYWNRPELTAQTFDVTLADDDSTGWLRTGDLGALVDGELFVTGRIKELLIVRGRNLFPQDVEQQARAAHEALRGLLGAAFGVAVPDERMVLIHEVNPRTPADELPAVATTVARRLTTTIGVPVRNVLLVRRGTVRRTTSGKIQRTAMRDRFLAGDIAALHAELEPEVRQAAAGGVG